MKDDKENKNKYPINFLDKQIFLLEKDRKDPLILMLIANVERAEKLNKDGYVWYTHLRDNYGLRLEPNLEKQLTDILIS